MKDEASGLLPPNLFQEVLTLSDELGEATDDLNDLLDQAEGVLTDLKLGVTASVDLGCPTADGSVRRLSFGKHKESWALLITVAEEPKSEPLPVTNASRQLRLRAVECIPALAVALVGEARDQVNAVHAANRTLRQFLEAFSRAEPVGVKQLENPEHEDHS